MAPATARRRPYKDFLQPALHRRFSTTATLLLAIAYIEAIYLANWESFFWSWFPIGPAGVRTLFLSICGLAVIVLRIAQYHVGLRTSDSAFSTFSQNVFKVQTLEAVFTYVSSAWLFSQLYLWSQPKDAGLEWVTYYSGDRARLNEKPLFLTCHFIIFGAAQAVLHLFRDNDKLSLGVVKPDDGTAHAAPAESAPKFRRLMDEVPIILIAAGTETIAGVTLSLFVYPIFLRATIWGLTMRFLRPFYSLPKTNMVPTHLPFSLWLLWRCVSSGFLLSFVWIAGNTAFSIFLVKEPLKNGKPLTSESKDPNGSLLNGLRSKKLSIQSFAMWELAFISRDFETRRKAIYEDIDRADGSMWSQISSICLRVVKDMEDRVDTYGKPPIPAPAAPAGTPNGEKRSTPPLKQESIMQQTPQRKSFRTEIEKAISQVVTAPGQPSQLSPVAHKALENVKTKILYMQHEGTGIEDPQHMFRAAALNILKSPVGWPFRQEYSRRISVTVLGTPYGEPSLYINAIMSLSQLAVHSLEEDKYGNVQRDIAAILRALTSITRKLELFKSTFPTHWTDVKHTKNTPEVDSVLNALKKALGDLVENFAPYARDLHLTSTDIRLATETAGAPQDARAVQGQEMRQVQLCQT